MIQKGHTQKGGANIGVYFLTHYVIRQAFYVSNVLLNLYMSKIVINFKLRTFSVFLTYFVHFSILWLVILTDKPTKRQVKVSEKFKYIIMNKRNHLPNEQNQKHMIQGISNYLA